MYGCLTFSILFIAGPLEAKYEGNNKWDIKNIRSVVDVFMNAISEVYSRKLNHVTSWTKIHEK